jgi:hypothetical protein
MPTRTRARHLLVALWTAFMLWAAGARADAIVEPGEPLHHGPLPRGSWFTLQTPHFNIHFYRDEAEFAERVAHFAERAYRLNTR